MSNKSPEYIRVRDELAKKLQEFNDQTPSAGVNYYTNWADSILSIKGVAILSDYQSYPDCAFYCPACDKIHVNHKLNLLDDNFRRLVWINE